MFRLHQVLDQSRQAAGEILHRLRPAVQSLDRIAAELREGVPVHVAPHLLKEHIRDALLAPIKNAIQDPHLRRVPGKPVSFRLVHPLLHLDADEVESQPIRVTIDLLPRLFIFGGRMPAPRTASVRAAAHDGDRFLDRMPGRAKTTPHGLNDVVAVDRDRHARLTLRRHARQPRQAKRSPAR